MSADSSSAIVAVEHEVGVAGCGKTTRCTSGNAGMPAGNGRLRATVKSRESLTGALEGWVKETRVTEDAKRRYTVFFGPDGDRCESEAAAMRLATTGARVHRRRSVRPSERRSGDSKPYGKPRSRAPRARLASRNLLVDEEGDEVTVAPRHSYIGPPIPHYGRVPAGSDLPGWTVARELLWTTDSDGNLTTSNAAVRVYRSPDGVACTRGDALIMTGQLEAPRTQLDTIRKVLQDKKEHETALARVMPVAESIRQAHARRAPSKWQCGEYEALVHSRFSKDVRDQWDEAEETDPSDLHVPEYEAEQPEGSNDIEDDESLDSSSDRSEDTSESDVEESGNTNAGEDEDGGWAGYRSCDGQGTTSPAALLPSPGCDSQVACLADSAWKCVPVVDLFCGVGGLSLGLRGAGWRNVLGVDHEAYCLSSYRKNRCGRRSLRVEVRKGDIGHWYEAFRAAGLVGDRRVSDYILVASPPCQPYSAAGIRCGGSDDRSGTEATIELIVKTLPAIAVIENVPSMMDEMFADHVQPLLGKVQRAGYVVRATVHSCTLYGVPQRRQRLLLTCVRRDLVDGLTEGRVTRLDIEKTTADRPPTSMDALSDRSLWRGRRPDALRISLSTIRARMRMRKENEVTGLVTAFQSAPSVIGTSLKDSSYHRLLAVPDDVDLDKIRYGRLRALQTKHVLTLQSFPQDFVLYGHRLFQSLCIGNAVPPMFAYSLGNALYAFLKNHRPIRQHASESHALQCIDTLKRELLARVPVV